ncbi:MAG: TM0106 family RecB-like putative nuclease [Candidatus Tyrphobacter sp.]
MQRLDGRLVYSASDLNGFLECAALTDLERRAAEGLVVRPEPDESTQLIARKGDEHEKRYLESLRASGRSVCEIEHDESPSAQGLRDAQRRTLEAMERGVDVVYQGTFFDGAFLGHADFLRRVERPSQRWAWSYEVLDTKLALSTKTYFLIQLCNYSEHLERLQGSMPQQMIVVAGNNVETPYETAAYLAYYRHLKAAFLERMEGGTDGAYPHEVPHCTICRWSSDCDERRNADDYLGIVAWMRRDDIRRLEESGITTIAQLAASQAQRPTAMKSQTFDRLRDQARLQHGTRTTGRLEYELLPSQEGRGFALLPPPDDGDLFFDIEGDPLYSPQSGLEYLFGVYFAAERRYSATWARSRADERRAFESVVDLLLQRRREHPGMHVYHYAPYETSALKHLAGHYATREDEVDALLRAQVFVDLFAIVRQGMRISQPSYSIKKLEPFYGFVRADTKTKRGDDSILMFESWLVSGEESILRDIEKYNEDDTVSTHRLREWLVERRAELCARDGDFPWKPPPEKNPEPEQPADPQSDLRAQLLDGLEPPESAASLRDAPEEYRVRWFLGHLLDYHRRDDKPKWWAYFHRCENRDELVEHDREALGDLTHCDDVTPYKLRDGDRTLVHAYDFPEQQHGFERGDDAWFLDTARPGKAGTIVKVDDEALRVHVKLADKVDAVALDALAPAATMPPGQMRDALARVAHSFIDGTLEDAHPALADILLRRTPRLRDTEPGASLQPNVPDAASMASLARRLDSSYLFIQGPPGSGKSTVGASIVLDLLAAGKRIAILANSHKVIHNLLHKIEEQAEQRGQSFRGIQRYSKSNESSRYASRVEGSWIETASSNKALEVPHHLVAGVAWTLADDDLVGKYDYLLIDEAGQVSLANAVACAPCARNVILLGDPMQLAQVSSGAHPPGLRVSVLEHLLGDRATVAPERGVFLDRSHRMHPAICSFISENVYDGRLGPNLATTCNRIDSPGLHGNGLRYLAVPHEGNRRESIEEAESIVAEVARLLQGTATTPDRRGSPVTKALAQNDILVVTPYNAQRRLITERLREAGLEGVSVGTVDKFQGQEAPVVFYSMATSSGNDLPRDPAFLFERNRFNVAVSRAQCMSVLVCSPRLLDIRCSTPVEMALVNLLCRYVEAARQ